MKNSGIDHLSKIFLIILLGLCVFGLIMVYSSSYIYAQENFGSSTYFLLRQFIFCIVGILVAFIVGKTRFAIWPHFSLVLHIVFLIFLLMTLIPSFSLTVKGASRWLILGPISLQPAEFIKYTIIFYSFTFFENFDVLNLQKKIFYGALLAIPLVILILQPDFGSFAICLFLIFFVAYMSSFERKRFYVLIASGLLAGLILIFTQGYRIQRVLTFLDPWENPKTTGFQIIQSYLAFARGSILGQGIGNGHEKLFYLPEAHNDFIFSVIGEELGLFGVFLVVISVLLLIFLGFKISLVIYNRLGKILITSVIFCFGLQCLLNMGVVLGLLPTKGLNLPFISYGGSSLIANFWGIGLILSVIKEYKNSVEFSQQNSLNSRI